jgi:glycosyltransferase involved in cell wall biosynthesis
MPPLVSIIIPCFNAQQMIEKCLQSCLRQTYHSIEIIVVDNNSTDGSMAVVERLKQQTQIPLTILKCLEPGGGRARNLGYTQAKGDYIQWLDADDELQPDKIERHVAALESAKECDIAYGSWTFLEWTNLKKWSLTAIRYEDFLFELLIDNWRPPHCYLLRRSIADRMHQRGGWTLERVAQDRHYFTWTALLGARFLAVPAAWVTYNRWSPKQVSASCSAAERGVILARMFQEMVTTQLEKPGSGFNEKHAFLLKMNRGLWTPANFGNPATQFEFSVRSALQDPKTYAVMRRTGSAPVFSIEFVAVLVIRSLWRRLASDPQKALEQLNQLFKITPPPTPEAVSLPYECILDSPPFLPVLCQYRLAALTQLVQLSQQGLLLPHLAQAAS